MSVVRYWSFSSMLFYIIIACIGLMCLTINKNKERHIGYKAHLFSWPYIIWWLLWTIVAAGRLVNNNAVGGTDAYAYATAFESIRGFSTSYSLERLYHYGVAWNAMCKVISHITTNYHIFFFIIYGFIVISFIIFLNEFVPTKIDLIPFILVAYQLIISFNTLRTSVSIALILLCIVCMKKGKPFWCIPLSLLSIAFQIASVVYVAFIPFYYLFKKSKLTLTKAIAFSVVSYIAGLFVRYAFGSGIVSISYYSNYAERSYSASFFEDYWKIVLGQLLLIIALITLRKFILAFSERGSDEDRNRLDFVWQMCMFDLMLIPFCYMIWMWRGCQYFYLARLIMWGEVVQVGEGMLAYNSKGVFRAIVFCLFLAWFVLMVSANSYRSGLMPYIFSPFYFLQ